jgi:hypothetical protein
MRSNTLTPMASSKAWIDRFSAEGETASNSAACRIEPRRWIRRIAW